MAKQRILYVSPEIFPYLPSTENSKLGKALAVGMHARKYEVRTFMPDYGSVNERRNQLHEVIRLSGINITIDDTDHPLIVKVASLQPSRIQVYFIDTDDYFQKLDTDIDALGSNRADNDERILFFSRATAGTAGKLQWEPDILHVSGWFGSLVPMYIKRIYNDSESFTNTKIIYTVLDEAPIAGLDKDFFRKLSEDGVSSELLKEFENSELNVEMLQKIAIANSDAVIFNTKEVSPVLEEYAKSKGLPILVLNPEEDNINKYHEFYQELLG